MLQLRVTIHLLLSALPVALAAQTPTLPLTAPTAGALALGEDFSVGLRFDGIARSWGSNSEGQLGTAAAVTVVQPIPTQLRASSSTAMTGVARVYAGRQHGLLITTAATGVLRAWGRNDSGQLGDNSVIDRTSCVAVVTTGGLTNVVAASAGYAHSLALKSDGTVWAWGNNSSGQVGDNTTINKLVPVRITPAGPIHPNTFQAVAAGHDHSLALRNDGTVWAWGANAHGQLGTGNTLSSLIPVQVQNLPAGLSVTNIVAGNGFSAVKLSDGTVRVWGRADLGQLGNDNNTASATPIQPLGLGDTVTALAAGDHHLLALKADGSVWGWGSNFQGELGSLVPAAQFTPKAIPGLANVAVIDATASRSGAVLTDGAILLWGDPSNSALGAAELGYRSTRIQLLDVKAATSIYAGGNQAGVVRANGRSYLWGENASAQLGIESFDPLAIPTRIEPWPDQAAYAFGSGHTLALAATGLYAAGDNTYGQLGDGTTTAKSTPVMIPVAGGTLTKVAAGWYHSLGLLANGSVVAWGRNNAGQLGFGATSASPTLIPTLIPNLTNVIAIAAGEAHSIALKSDGTVWAWGDNTHGQSAGSGTAPILIPTQVTGPNNIQAIAAGANHSLALTSATHPTSASRNRVYAWGRGDYGQIGNNTTNARVTTPAFLATTLIAAIAAGENHSLARRTDGTVYAWGRNHRGQVGNAYVATYNADTTAKVLVPTAVASIPAASAVSSIAAGLNSSYAVFGNGTAYGWGEARNQQLAYAPSRLVPVAWRLTNNPADADADGMLNAWETARFGSTTSKSGYVDTDLDGLLDIQEHYYGSIPANYPSGTVGADSDGDLLNDFADSDRNSPYNGNSYNIILVSGDNQWGVPGATAANPVTAQVGASSVPVYIAAEEPSIRLATSSAGVPAGGVQLSLTTNSSGHAAFHYRYRDTAGAARIRISAGADFIFAHTTSIANSTHDTDFDGLPDQWEATFLGNLLSNGQGDANGDGLLNRDAYRFGLNPSGVDPSLQPAEIDIFGYDARGWLNSVTPRNSVIVPFILDDEGNVKTAN